jgi:hypothetical protein
MTVSNRYRGENEFVQLSKLLFTASMFNDFAIR